MPARDTEVTTIEALLALPEDGVRHELLDGEHVVTPSPRYLHQAVLSELFLLIGNAIAHRDDLIVLSSPADVVLGPRTLVQPDIFVVAKAAGARLKAWADVGIPILAVEVLSPSTASRDRGEKRKVYQQAGVGDYWIVDIDARLVERWKPDDIRPEVISDHFDWIAPNSPGISFNCGDFFRSASE